MGDMVFEDHCLNQGLQKIHIHCEILMVTYLSWVDINFVHLVYSTIWHSYLAVAPKLPQPDWNQKNHSQPNLM